MKWRLFIAVVLGMGSEISFAQATEWGRYVIPDTGANVDIPVSIFTEDAGAPEGGTGRRFFTQDRRADLTIQSVPNSRNDTPAEFLQKRRPPPGIHGGDWTVSKSSGEVWLSAAGLQQASLKQDDVLKAGQTVSTGRSGRALLKRGDETILISPNSVIGLPAEKKEGLSTTIVQRAGSILLDVEKRNVKHFEVETPYMAAVVKGTQFRVTINAGNTTVDVVRGQVEVADFKSGQIAQVTAGQHATAFASGKIGLSLGGAGALAPIEQGKPRAPSIERVPVPRNGLSAPRNAANERSRQPSRQGSAHAVHPGVVRISSPIGEVRLNVHRVTHGLARDNSAVHGGSREVKNDTTWSRSDAAVANNGQGNAANAAANSSNSAASNTSTTIAASSGSNGGSNSGQSNNGNGNGNGNGANGNGRRNGNGNGNGHGNGNNGNGQGNGNGNGNGRGNH